MRSINVTITQFVPSQSFVATIDVVDDALGFSVVEDIPVVYRRVENHFAFFPDRNALNNAVSDSELRMDVIGAIDKTGTEYLDSQAE